jgi:hypothetical protein
MAQEEMISAAFMAAIIWLVLAGRRNAAIFVCAMGVLSAKIYFLVPLLGLVVFHPRGIPLAVAPLVAAYGVETYFRFRNGLGLPLSNFTPPATMGVTFWSEAPRWLGISYETAKRLSMPLALAAGLLPLFVIRPWNRPVEPKRIVHMLTAMLLGVFAFFYYISPEYYIFTVCGLMMLLPRWKYLLVMFVMFPIGWSVNFFWGVHNASLLGVTSGGKGMFVRAYNAIFPFETGTMRDVSLGLFVVFTFALWISVLIYLRMRRSE